MIRKLVAKLNQTLAKNSVAARKNLQVPIKVWFEPDNRTGKLEMPVNLTITGETQDLSSSGIGFIVSSIRIRENYLIGDNRTLTAELDLPEGKVQMQIVGRRHQQVGQHISTARFLIGAEIVKITHDNREDYEYYLRHDGKRVEGKLMFGVDER